MMQLELLTRPTHPKTSQRQLWTLLHALRNGERLTVLTALERYQIYALSQRCGQLRSLGWDVQSRMVSLPSGKSVAEYWLN